MMNIGDTMVVWVLVMNWAMMKKKLLTMAYM